MLPENTTISLLADLRQLIEQSRQRAVAAVNAELTLLYWSVGQRLQLEILRGDRAEYGKQVVSLAAQRLTLEFGRGWSARQLWMCIQLVTIFPDRQIVHTLCAELSWSHLRLLLGLEQPLQRDIAALREQGTLSPDLAFRDPYVLDFLGLADSYAEKDLESAIVAELQRFIIELGSDFAFMARQKRITIDTRDYTIDLLFYHRRLRCLVAIELKIGEFQAAYKGQMELYLRYLEKHEQAPGENTPIGLILCTGKNEEHVELLQLDQSNIRVADYLTLLPAKEVLQDKLHRSIELARQRLAAPGLEDGV